MHCPKCGQLQVSEETRFCSRCGLLLTEIAGVVANDGVVRRNVKGSARNRGLKQGLFLLLLSILIVPIAAIITVASRSEPFVAVALLFITVIGGLLRMAYALLFESNEPGRPTLEQNAIAEAGNLIDRIRNKKELAAPPANSVVYAPPEGGNWRDTNDLNAEPSSVTDNTTKLLHQEHDS